MWKSWVSASCFLHITLTNLLVFSLIANYFGKTKADEFQSDMSTESRELIIWLANERNDKTFFGTFKEDNFYPTGCLISIIYYVLLLNTQIQSSFNLYKCIVVTIALTKCRIRKKESTMLHVIMLLETLGNA